MWFELKKTDSSLPINSLHNYKLNERMNVKETILVIYKKFVTHFTAYHVVTEMQKFSLYKRKPQNKQTKPKK